MLLCFFGGNTRIKCASIDDGKVGASEADSDAGRRGSSACAASLVLAQVTSPFSPFLSMRSGTLINEALKVQICRVSI
jgi:hypothetical protein